MNYYYRVMEFEENIGWNTPPEALDIHTKKKCEFYAKKLARERDTYFIVVKVEGIYTYNEEYSELQIKDTLIRGKINL